MDILRLLSPALTHPNELLPAAAELCWDIEWLGKLGFGLPVGRSSGTIDTL